MRDANGFLVYDDEFRRRFMTPREIAASDKWVKKHSSLITAKEHKKISEEEYERLCNKLDAEHEEELSQIYDEDFGSQTKKAEDENFFTGMIFANA